MNAHAHAIFAPAETLTAAVVWGGTVLEHPVGQNAGAAAARILDLGADFPNSRDTLKLLRYSIPSGIIAYSGEAPEGVTYAAITPFGMMGHEFGQTLADAVHDHDREDDLIVVRYDLRAGTIADVTEEAAAELLSVMDDEDVERAPGWMQGTAAYDDEAATRDACNDDWGPEDDLADYRMRVM